MTSLPSRGRVCAALPGLARAAEPTVEIAAGGETRSYTRGELAGEARCRGKGVKTHS